MGRQPQWLVVSLDWPICPDGVEIVDYGVRGVASGGQGSRLLDGTLSGRYFQYKSDARATGHLQHHELKRLDTPMVTRFVSAKDDIARLKFLSRFGIPVRVGSDPAPRQKLSSVMAMQCELEGLLKALNDKDPRTLAEVLIELMTNIRAGTLTSVPVLSGKKLKRTVQARSPFAFMLTEIEVGLVCGSSGPALRPLRQRLAHRPDDGPQIDHEVLRRQV